MDGLLLIDKPEGPTSHDVVAAMRRSSGERQIGHTGTLDPRATGLLPLVVGRATRLASRLSGAVKSYDAEIALGVSTDTDDAEGQPTGSPAETLPDEPAIAAAIGTFLGTFTQVPPAHSAKRVGGRRAYDLARRRESPALDPVMVTVHALERIGGPPARPRLRLRVSSGFYVRALARDLGARLGCGGHLAKLRRTAVGRFEVSEAIALEAAMALGTDLADRLVAPAAMLPDAPAIRLTTAGVAKASHGNSLHPEHFHDPGPNAMRVAGEDGTAETDVRLLDAEGDLVGLARWKGGVLHPILVLRYNQ